jgi:hypothetical protein
VLLALRDFIQQHRMVSAELLSREFRIAPEALAPMMAVWINKGLVRRQDDPAGCGTSCRSCAEKNIVYYAWVDLPCSAAQGRLGLNVLVG